MNDNALKVARDQILFISSFFLIFGIVYLDAYYSEYGFTYSWAGSDTTRIVYRGFSLIYFNVYFVSISISIALGVLLTRLPHVLRLRWGSVRFSSIGLTILSAGLVAGIWIAFNVGHDKAAEDMYPDTTSLRQLTHFHSPNPEKQKVVNDLLSDGVVLILRSSDDKLRIFLVPSTKASRPRSSLYTLGLGSDDFFTDRAPAFR